MTDPSSQWSESTSDTFRELAAVAVPHRAEQMAVLLTLVPFEKEASFKVVELSSGEGLLSWAILSAFPAATLLALEYEDTMRQETERRLQPYGSRASVAAYDLRATDWFEQLAEADVVVSSLTVHHLDAQEKQRLFQAVAARLSQRGALLLADIILPQRAEARALFSHTWDESSASASQELFGSERVFENFQAEHWNFFRYPNPEFDKPSPLSQQLAWLKEAGFAVVDCFWLRAGHAIYGGYKSAEGSGGPSYDASYQVALKALKSNP